MALLHKADASHHRALREVQLAPRPRLLCAPVLIETIFHLGASCQPRLGSLLEEEVFQWDTAAWPATGPRALEWLHAYAEHLPDFADAYLVARHEAQPGSQVWTFDSEFRTTWRTSKGKRIKLVGRK